MRIDLMNKSKKQDFLKGISYLGDFKTNALFLSAGKEQIRIYSGGLLSDEIMKIWRHFPIEMVGLYFGKEFIDRHGNKESRLSLDGLHAIQDQVTKNIVEIDSIQNEIWFKGNNLELTYEQKETYKEMIGQFVAVKFKEDFVGTAKLSEQGILISFLPKERRIRSV
jgi:NOL1/NOP2/fmu family ribosome biogenesis protein